MELFLRPETWIALLTLSFMEIILGIDNIIFISLVSNKLEGKNKDKARITGLSLAIIVRILMLIGITWLIGFTQPIIDFNEFHLSGRDIILALGGFFLLAKSTSEIHSKIDGISHETKSIKVLSVKSAIIQIVLLDIVFSFDSILTAVGLTNHVILMIFAVIISMIIMMVFAGKIADFIDKYPTMQVLALAFLILIGFMLVLEALQFHVPKGYIYFAVFFSLAVEFINIKIRKKIKKS
jgi:predicted tellurium resistance membrane protein TerC